MAELGYPWVEVPGKCYLNVSNLNGENNVMCICDFQSVMKQIAATTPTNKLLTFTRRVQVDIPPFDVNVLKDPSLINKLKKVEDKTEKTELEPVDGSTERPAEVEPTAESDDWKS